MYGNPGTGKTHTAIGLGIKACLSGYNVLYASVPRLLVEIILHTSFPYICIHQKLEQSHDDYTILVSIGCNIITNYYNLLE